ncbi:MAG: SpoIID/LytB domain-containing protein [Vampirovibrionales bacterium]|nr:SpoIID/LytB domain-containing protein [Vampirovibrionales bacterium]
MIFAFSTAPRIRHALVWGFGLACLSMIPVQAALVVPQTPPAASTQWLQPLQHWWETVVATALSAVPLPNSAPNSAVGVPDKSSTLATGWNPTWLAKNDLIRVGLSDDAMEALEYPTTRVGATIPWQLWDANNPMPVMAGTATDVITLRVTAQGFLVTAVPLVKPVNATSNAAIPKEVGPFVGPLRLIPVNETGRVTVPSITRRGQVPQFKGVLEVVRGYSAPNKLTTVNVVGLQDYLKAVVPNELPPRYGFEAVKAQSIAARNYAIRPREKPWPSFDICDSQYCQVYFGAQTEHPTSNRAVDETEGLVALYEGRPILALFSSSHGGHSESYENAFADGKTFPAEPIPYLRGRPDTMAVAQLGDLSIEANAQRFWGQAFTGDYDVKTAYHRWERVWTVGEFSQALKTQWPKVWKDTSTRSFLKVVAYTPPPSGSILGSAFPITTAPMDITTLDGATVDTGSVQRVDVVRRGVSGKAMTVLFTTTTGQFQASREFVIRKLLTHQGKMLPSANVVADYGHQPDGKLATIRVRGGGFGHGVGLSQIGASTLSDEGYTFDRIVQHYYTGVSLGSMPVAIGLAPNKALEAAQQPVTHIKVPLGTSQARLVVSSPTAGPVVVSIDGQHWTIPLGATASDVSNSTPALIASNNAPVSYLQQQGNNTGFQPATVTASLFDWIRGGNPKPTPSSETTLPSPTFQQPFLPSIKPVVPFQPKTTGAILATWLTASAPLPPSLVVSGSRHSIALVPDANHPQRPVRAWLELIPPRAQPLKRP